MVETFNGVFNARQGMIDKDPNLIRDPASLKQFFGDESEDEKTTTRKKGKTKSNSGQES